MAMPEDMRMRMYLCRIGSQQPRGHSLSFRLRLLLPCRRLMAALPLDLGRPPLLPPHPQPAPPLDLLFTDPPDYLGRPPLLPPQPPPSIVLCNRVAPPPPPPPNSQHKKSTKHDKKVGDQIYVSHGMVWLRSVETRGLAGF